MIECRATTEVESTTVVGKGRLDAIALIVVSLLEDSSFFASSATQFTSYTRCQLQDMHRKPCTLFLRCQTSFLRAAAADTMLFSGFMQCGLGHALSFLLEKCLANTLWGRGGGGSNCKSKLSLSVAAQLTQSRQSHPLSMILFIFILRPGAVLRGARGLPGSTQELLISEDAVFVVVCQIDRQVLAFRATFWGGAGQGEGGSSWRPFYRHL